MTQTTMTFKNKHDKNLSIHEGNQTNKVSLNPQRKPLVGLRRRYKYAWHCVSFQAYRWTLELRRFFRRKQKVKKISC